MSDPYRMARAVWAGGATFVIIGAWEAFGVGGAAIVMGLVAMHLSRVVSP